MLYGAGGMVFDGPSMRRVARTLADDGDTVYLLHYFNRTGTVVALDSTMQKHFEGWLETMRDGIAWVHGREEKGSGRLGLYGYSLGGFLAIAAASDNPRVGAVTTQAGGIWNSQEKRIGKMPPVLIVHGLDDGRVPLEKYAKPLMRVLAPARRSAWRRSSCRAKAMSSAKRPCRRVRPKVAKFFARELR